MSPPFQRLDDLPNPEIHRRNLPHWESPEATYFVTFRTADSIPSGIIREIQVRQMSWLRAHGLKTPEELRTLPLTQQLEYRKTINQAEEQAMNAGYGACPLREAKCRETLASLLRGADGTSYHLDHFVIMPNHVHIVVKPKTGIPLRQITGSWKKHSARRINATLHQAGKLWQPESFDHIVRSVQQLDQYRRCIAENPSKANLRPDEYTLGQGSGILP
jgi:putative transposase